MPKFKFTWGDDVQVIADAPPQFRPGHHGTICGLREVETEREATAVGFPKGSRLYLLEFSDGASLEIGEQFLGRCRSEQ